MGTTAAPAEIFSCDGADGRVSHECAMTKGEGV